MVRASETPPTPTRRVARDAARQAVDWSLAATAANTAVARDLAFAFGYTHPEAGTCKAIHAVLDQLDNPLTNRAAWVKHGVGRGAFKRWKKHLVQDFLGTDEVDSTDSSLASALESRDARLAAPQGGQAVSLPPQFVAHAPSKPVVSGDMLADGTPRGVATRAKTPARFKSRQPADLNLDSLKLCHDHIGARMDKLEAEFAHVINLQQKIEQLRLQRVHAEAEQQRLQRVFNRLQHLANRMFMALPSDGTIDPDVMDTLSMTIRSLQLTSVGAAQLRPPVDKMEAETQFARWKRRLSDAKAEQQRLQLETVQLALDINTFGVTPARHEVKPY